MLVGNTTKRSEMDPLSAFVEKMTGQVDPSTLALSAKILSRLVYDHLPTIMTLN